MEQAVPKQFTPIGGQPILMHTLAAFYRCSPDIRIITVLPKSEISTWQGLCQHHNFRIPHITVAGGTTRSASVDRGLRQIDGTDGLVAVHDGVRPLVTPSLIEDAYQAADRWGSAIASVPLKDSIRQVDADESQARSREQYRLVQTPQTFRLNLLQAAYEAIEIGRIFSDDASVVEHYGHVVHLIEGEYRNIKVTTPEDLVVAEALLAQLATKKD